MATTSTSSIDFTVMSGIRVNDEPRLPDHSIFSASAPFGIMTFFIRAMVSPLEVDLPALVRDGDVQVCDLDAEHANPADKRIDAVRIVQNLNAQHVQLQSRVPRRPHPIEWRGDVHAPVRERGVSVTRIEGVVEPFARNSERARKRPVEECGPCGTVWRGRVDPYVRPETRVVLSVDPDEPRVNSLRGRSGDGAVSEQADLGPREFDVLVDDVHGEAWLRADRLSINLRSDDGAVLIDESLANEISVEDLEGNPTRGRLVHGLGDAANHVDELRRPR